MKYIYVSQGKTARYEPNKTPSEVEGIYTNKFSHCNIVILIGKRTNRISLTHADYYMNERHFIAEMEWVDDYSNDPEIEKIIIARQYIKDSEEIRKKILPQFSEFFTIHNIEENYDGVLFKTNGKIIRLQNSEKLPQSQKYEHPQQQDIDRVYKINDFLNIGYLQDRKNTALIYNGANWSTLLKHDLELTDIAKQRLAKVQLTSDLSIDVIKAALYQLMLNNRKHYQYFLNNKAQCEIMLNLHAPLLKDYLIWKGQKKAVTLTSHGTLLQEDKMSDLLSKIGINSLSNKSEESEKSLNIKENIISNTEVKLIDQINAILGNAFIKKYIATGKGNWQVERTNIDDITLSFQGLQIANKSDCEWFKAKLLKGGIKEYQIHFDELKPVGTGSTKYQIRLTHVQNIEIGHNFSNIINNIKM